MNGGPITAPRWRKFGIVQAFIAGACLWGMVALAAWYLLRGSR